MESVSDISKTSFRICEVNLFRNKKKKSFMKMKVQNLIQECDWKTEFRTLLKMSVIKLSNFIQKENIKKTLYKIMEKKMSISKYAHVY